MYIYMIWTVLYCCRCDFTSTEIYLNRAKKEYVELLKSLVTIEKTI